MRFVLVAVGSISILWLLSPSRAQSIHLSSLPACAKNCVGDTYSIPDCHPLSSPDASCFCQHTALLGQAKSCYNTLCSRKDVLSALNITSISCDEPVRNKWENYRILNLTFFALAVAAMAAQWVARSTAGRLRWLDDGNMVLVLALDTVLFATCFKMSYTGLGQDMWKVPFSNITSTLLYFWISEIVYFCTLGFIKIAFLLFFLQIFPEKRFRRVVWGIIFFSIASTIAFGLAATFVCSPVSFAWKQWDGEHTGTCINNNTLAFTHAAHSIFVDFVTLSLPVTQIWKLHLATKKKIGVLLMFSVGAFVTVVSMLRLKSLVHFANTTNMTWDYLEASIWSIIECQVGIICVCMPSIRLGLTRLFPGLLGSTHHSTSKNAHGAAGASGRIGSQGNALSGLTANEINVQTTFKISHARKPQTNDDERSFVQLVEIDADAKSAKS